MRTIIGVLLIFFAFLSSSVRGQEGEHELSSDLYEKEFPVLRSFKNKRITEIEALGGRMLLVPTYTNEGAEIWRTFLDFARQSLISFPLDAYDKDDEDYWNRIIATICPWFYICCDQLEGREKEAYNNALTLKEFLYHAYKYKEVKQTTWEDVRDMLDESEVAIELRLMPDEALILKKGFACPISVPIDSTLIDQLGYYKGTDAVEISEMYAPEGPLARLWATIKPSIAGATRIYLSASHFLCNFNYGAIPTTNGSTIDQEYDYHYLMTTEDIRSLKARSPKPDYLTAAIFGDITYDVDEDTMRTYASNTQSTDQPVWDLTRGMDDETRGKLLPLKHSSEEITAISHLLDSKGVSVRRYDTTHANEETFKQVVKSKPEIIHLSTHGFMLAPVYSDSDSKPCYPKSQTASRYATTMLKSGLLLSGASRAWNGKAPLAGIEDGILTTKELLEMDFKGTKLAVLSACKTGLGNDTNLTGLSFGPQHALKAKGVEQIVMSLWMVDDAATTLLMTYFYEALLSGASTKDSLKVAQQKLIKDGYSDPYYWAAFVVLE